MTQFLHKLLFLIPLIFVMGLDVYAADEVGAEIRYECLDSDQSYRIYVTRYFDCNSSVIVNEPEIDISSASACQAPVAQGAWTLERVVEVTPLCPGLPTHCNGGTPPVANGIKEYIYSRDYSFAGAMPGCDDYVISYTSCCRSDSIDSGSKGARRYVQVRNFDPFLCNQAPNFLFSGPVYLDDSVEARVSFGAEDPEGDSLSFSLVACRDTLGVSVTYLPGFSPAQPLGPAWNTQLDPLTGNVNFLPQNGGAIVAPIAIEVKEYRKGQLIGSYIRDVLVESLTSLPDLSSPSFPQLERPSTTGVIMGGTWIDSFTVSASLGRPLNFELNVQDAEADSALVQWTANIPGAEFVDQTDPTRRRDTFVMVDPVPAFSWTPPHGGRFSFGIQILENKWCGATRIGDYAISLLVRDTCLLAQFDMDSMLICPGDSVYVNPELKGNSQGPYQYNWSTGSHSDSIKISSPGTYWVQVFDKDTVCVSSDTLVVGYAEYCIWPGDANNDGLANNLDVLAIGLGYGATGPARPNASLNWEAQQADSWGDTIMGGVDLVYLDTDGSDSIEMLDTLGISVNYSLSHPQKGGSGSGGAGDPLLYFSPPNGPAGPGDTLHISIFLGTDTLPADSVYGIAFSVSYDNALVDTNTAHFHLPDSSWLGTHYSDLFSLQHDKYEDGLIDVGISRNDHTSRTSHGKIARLDIIMIDDITAKKNIVDTLTLNFEEIYIIRLDGSIIPVNALSVDIPVTDGVNTDIPDLLPEEEFSLYPNPTTGLFRLSAEKSGPYTLELFNSSGQLLQSGTMHSRSMSLDLRQQSPGLYLLRIRHEKGILTRKIQLTR